LYFIFVNVLYAVENGPKSTLNQHILSFVWIFCSCLLGLFV